MIHELKTESGYFEDVISGRKTFEVRKNDRNFYVGDFLALNELTTHMYGIDMIHLPTGRSCLVEVVYMLGDKRYVPEGYVILGIKPCKIVRDETGPLQVY